MTHVDLHNEHARFKALCPMCRDNVPVDGHPFVGLPMRGDFVMCKSCRSFLTVVSLHPLRLQMSGNRADAFPACTSTMS